MFRTLPRAFVARHTAWSMLSFVEAWRERRFVAQSCGALLKLHDEVAGSHPELSGFELYRSVVVVYCNCSVADADSILQRAEESYAVWPVARELRFRDVAHYLGVSGYLTANKSEHWIQSQLQPVIDSSIPSRL